jgi:formate hydrogenlyase subunit 6/NADH:ubiquinone oxidoreductase subunit I
MTDIYRKLAIHLDTLPAGFPSTDSGIEIRILKRLFTPQEAEIAVALTPLPESAADIAGRMQKDEKELEDILLAMSKKGLIFRMTKDDRMLFMAAQFMIGIWEYHVNDLDEDLIRDVNEYIPTFMKQSWLKHQTKQLRVIPISKSISAEMTIMPYEAAEAIIRDQKKIVVSPCICRKEHGIVGKNCGKPMDVCLSFGAAAAFYEDNQLGRPVSQEEALEILSDSVRAGLVIQPGNAQKPVNICLCCGCCCQILKNLKTLDEPAKAVSSNYFARAIPDNCIACGSCADVCQMDAIDIRDTAEVRTHRCIGCGLCVAACDYDAMTLVLKDESDRYVPPANTVQTYMRMLKERRAA